MKINWFLVSMLALTGCGSALTNYRAVPRAAHVEEPLPIPLITLSGSPEEMGRTHGTALREPIHRLLNDYLKMQLDSPPKQAIAYTAASLFASKIPSEFNTEIRALAAAAQIDVRDAVLAQCFLDLHSSIACSTIALPASASPDGVARLGRNLDFPGNKILDDTSVVFAYRPPGKNRFVVVSWPGLIGALSGMNEHGLTLANMEIPRSPRFPSGMPYILLYRKVLEECRDVDEAIALLQSSVRQSTNNLMLMDAAGNRAAIEITPEALVVRRGTEDAALISTNHQRGQDTTTSNLCWRYDLLRTQAGESFGTIGVKQLEQLLSRVQQKDWTIQSMVFEPSTRVMYLATGTMAAEKNFYRVDLAALLKK